jgi:tetratricopeptide (TPR) repeat protein
MKSLTWISILGAGLGLSVAAQQWINAIRPASAVVAESLYLTSGETLKRASVGFDGLLADIYWIRTIQYFGENLARQRETRTSLDPGEMVLLEPMLKMTTELDPHHIAAYRFGAFVLPSSDPEGALRFTQQGIRNNPDEWRLYQDLGLIYWKLGRYREAGEIYRRGAEVKGAPEWMITMSATMIARGGDRATARELFERLYQETNDEFIKQVCEEHLKQLR